MHPMPAIQKRFYAQQLSGPLIFGSLLNIDQRINPLLFFEDKSELIKSQTTSSTFLIDHYRVKLELDQRLLGYEVTVRQSKKHDQTLYGEAIQETKIQQPSQIQQKKLNNFLQYKQGQKCILPNEVKLIRNQEKISMERGSLQDTNESILQDLNEASCKGSLIMKTSLQEALTSKRQLNFQQRYANSSLMTIDEVDEDQNEPFLASFAYISLLSATEQQRQYRLKIKRSKMLAKLHKKN